MLKLDKNSALVRVWVNLILQGEKRIEDCPTFFNLRNSVEEVLKEEEKGDK
jgi:hypothetical protein